MREDLCLAGRVVEGVLHDVLEHHAGLRVEVHGERRSDVGLVGPHKVRGARGATLLEDREGLHGRELRHAPEQVRAFRDLGVEEVAHVALVTRSHGAHDFHAFLVNGDGLRCEKGRDPGGVLGREVLLGRRVQRGLAVGNQPEDSELGDQECMRIEYARGDAPEVNVVHDRHDHDVGELLASSQQDRVDGKAEHDASEDVSLTRAV